MSEENVVQSQKWSWSAFWSSNALFFGGFILLLIVGGLILFFIDYGEAIFFFSERRTWFGDQFFKYFTKLGEEGVYIAALIILLFIRYRFALVIPLIGGSVALISYYLKSFFAHARPSLYFQQIGIFEQINVVDGIKLYGGQNSFPSGHTMSAFAFYAFLAFCFSKNKILSLIFLIFALLVAVSRIYLVQHFLQDVYLGAIVGVMVGIVWYYLIFLLPQPHRWLDKSLWKGK